MSVLSLVPFFFQLVFDRLQPITDISLQKPRSYHHTDGYLNTYVGRERPDKPTGSTDGKLTRDFRNLKYQQLGMSDIIGLPILSAKKGIQNSENISIGEKNVIKKSNDFSHILALFFQNLSGSCSLDQNVYF